MANVIIPKRSTTAAAVPSAGSLQTGEIAINLADKKLYAKDGSGAVVEIGGGAAGGTTGITWHGAVIRKSSVQSISGSTNTQVTFSTASLDTDGFWSSGTPNRITIPSGVSKIRITANVDTGAENVDVQNWVAKNGSAAIADAVAFGSAGALLGTKGAVAVSSVLSVSAGDYFEVWAWANGAWTVDATSNTYLEVTVVEGSVLGSFGAGATSSPGGSINSVQYNNSGALAGAANVDIDGGDLMLNANASPTTPASGNVKLFGKTIASRVFPAFVGATNIDAAVQPSIWRQKIAFLNPPGNSSASITPISMAGFTNVGTATARNVASTNLLTRTRRIGFVSAGTAGSLSGTFLGVAQFTTGDGTGLGGFFTSFRFAFSDAASVSGARAFIGMTSSIATPGNAEPSTLTNAVGVAQLSTDSTQLYIVYGGSAAQTAIALGTNFPPYNGSVSATNGAVYDLTLYAPPSANGVIHYRVERVGTTFAAEGTLTPATPGTQTPLSTTFLAPRFWRCNNATASAVGIDVLNLYIETDY